MHETLYVMPVCAAFSSTHYKKTEGDKQRVRDGQGAGSAKKTAPKSLSSPKFGYANSESAFVCYPKVIPENSLLDTLLKLRFALTHMSLQ